RDVDHEADHADDTELAEVADEAAEASPQTASQPSRGRFDSGCHRYRHVPSLPVPGARSSTPRPRDCAELPVPANPHRGTAECARPFTYSNRGGVMREGALPQWISRRPTQWAEFSCSLVLFFTSAQGARQSLRAYAELNPAGLWLVFAPIR